jgi:hypothetical protein
MLFEHHPHPRARERREAGPVKAAAVAGKRGWGAAFNARVATLITLAVGTVWCFYVFNGIALVSLPTAIRTHNLTVLINWVSSNWIQLILLPALMVGQRVQGEAADARSEQTYRDAEIILHECLELQRHLEAQDEVLAGMIKQVRPGLRSRIPSRAPRARGAVFRADGRGCFDLC